MRKIFLLVFVIFLGFYDVQEISAKEVGNAEIQGAILTLVHSFNVVDNKLERHEHRERALGEVIKRALQALQKGQKAYEPILGQLGRLDDRLSEIESALIKHEDKFNDQSAKLTDTIESMFKWMTEHAACNKESSSSGISGDQQTKLIEKIDKLSERVEKLDKTCDGLQDQLMNSKMPSTDEVLSKMEDKLSHFYITGPISTPSPVASLESENRIISYLDKIYGRIGELKSCQNSEGKLSSQDKDFLESLCNDTQKSIGELKQEFATTSARALTQTNENFKELCSELQKDISKISANMVDSKSVTDNFCSDVNISIATLQNELDVFNKFDKVLLTTSDYVLDTQRKVEYGTHQVILKIGDLIKTQNSDLNTTVHKCFDEMNEVVTSNHKETLQNVSSTMETEISHVWRQIGIMHGEITYCKDALDKLQGQTEMYVNGTLSTMDSMGGKVSVITGRMGEVDENLNYLLGKLSLVTQEFNQIKSGLGKALDEIRISFKTVQDKVEDVGPGPHPITGEAEYK